MSLRALCALLLACAPAAAAQNAPATRASFESLLRSSLGDPARIVPALVEGSRLYPSLDPGEARKLGDTLEVLAERVYFSSERLPGMERLGLVEHAVQSGENPTTIAARYDVGPELLAFTNPGLEPKRLRAGERLKVLDLAHGELAIEVERASYRLAAWRQLAEGGRALVLYVPVGLGTADSPTPAGRTSIVKRVLDPQWTDPLTKRVHAPRAPENLLGGYWIALDSAPLGRTGIGFHGYSGAPSETWIQQAGSQGCVRLLQHDIARLYHLATEGARVELR